MYEEFQRQLKAEEKSKSTIAKYIRDVNEFLQGRELSVLRKDDAIAHKRFLAAKNKPATVNSKIISMNRFFKYEKREDMLLKPLRMQRQIFLESEKILTKGEYLLLLEKSQKDKRLNLILQTLASTGIRISELPYITVKAARERHAFVNNKGKYRTVLLPTDLCIKMLQYTNEMKIDSGPVFQTRNGQPMNRSNIWRDMKALAEKSGISTEKVYPHNFRHLFAATYYSKEKDLAKLADLLGHSSVDTTRLYIVSDGREHAKQIDFLGLTT